jgi:hypothetical protein
VETVHHLNQAIIQLWYLQVVEVVSYQRVLK